MQINFMQRKPKRANSKRRSREFSPSDMASDFRPQVSSPIEDIIWILWLVLFIIASLSLLSWSADDIGWFQVSSKADPSNLLGRFGAIFADLMVFSFGMSSIWLPVLFGTLFFRSLKEVLKSRSILKTYLSSEDSDDIPEHDSEIHPLTSSISKIFGYSFILAGSTVIEAQRFTFINLELKNGAGGALGVFLGGMGEYALGSVGLTVVSLSLFFIGLSLFFSFSWFDFFEFGGRASEKLFFSGKSVADKIGDGIVGAKALKSRIKKIKSFRKGDRTFPPKNVVIRPAIEKNNLSNPQQKKLFDCQSKEELIPPISLLSKAEMQSTKISEKTLSYISGLIEMRLKDFGVEVKVVSAQPGPVVTLYEIEPAVGVKGAQIVALAKDLARSLSLFSIRVVETIPGKNLMGLELPNVKRETVRLSEILSSKNFFESPFELPIGLGKDISGKPVVVDLSRMPHLLIAGTTGSGKSVGINGALLSLIYKSTPEDVRFILIDPKMLEFSMYEDIPHLLTPVVVDVRKASTALAWCVGEMERRYKLLSHLGVRSLSSLNKKIENANRDGNKILNPFWEEDKAGEFLDEDEFDEAKQPNHESDKYLEKIPKIIIVIDELADLMMVVGKKVEALIARLAQKARAAGIHLVLATQRPSVDVITGLIKANIPARMSYQVSSRVDSRTILDQMGAESLLGQGDMLVQTPGSGVLYRVHGAFVSDEEVGNVVSYIKKVSGPNYDENIYRELDDQNLLFSGGGFESESQKIEQEPLFDDAVKLILKHRRASISFVQRHMRIGYNRAARLLESMEKKGIVSEMQANGSRKILIDKLGDK